MAVDKSFVHLWYEALITNNKQLHTKTHVAVLTNVVCALLHVTLCKNM